MVIFVGDYEILILFFSQAVEQARRSAAAPQLVVPDVAFTPINPAKGGAGTDLETPATAFVYKDDLNIESMVRRELSGCRNNFSSLNLFSVLTAWRLEL